jgi:predicted nucleic acid-binding protein
MDYELTAYDAAYLELAARLNVPLLTYDKLLLEAAKKLKLKSISDLH